MTTFVPGEGLKNFRGIWRANYLKPDNTSVKMEIRIKDMGERFAATLLFGEKVKKITGRYAAKSRYLESKSFSFRMLPDFDNDIASVAIPAGIFTPSRIVISFARENQDMDGGIR
jgi:hypothetical protein